MEWILMSVMALAAPVGEPGPISVTTVPGFTSSQACEVAAKQLAEVAIRQTWQLRRQNQVPDSARLSAPRVQFECVPVRK